MILGGDKDKHFSCLHMSCQLGLNTWNILKKLFFDTFRNCTHFWYVKKVSLNCTSTVTRYSYFML